jgi:alpha-1,3-rhamnosyl/mannosyltransferase
VRVVFNLLPTLKAKTGVGHYAARLFAALREQMPEVTLHGFPTGSVAAVVRRFQSLRKGGSPSRNSPIAAIRSTIKTVAAATGRRCLGLAFRASCRRGYDLYHEPNFVPMTCNVPTIVTVHDLSVLLHPEWHPADRVRYHERTFRRGVAGAANVITVSRFVRRQVIETIGIAADRVTAVDNGVGSEYLSAGPADAERVRRDLNLPEKYLLFVGTIEPRKNLPALVRAYRDLPLDLRRRCPLIVAGGWGWRAAESADALRAAANDGVIHLGYTDDRHLPGLYAGARALVFPSFYEGFGLPPLETLACGGAVLASTADAVREVLGNHAHFVEPLDVSGWRSAMNRAITDNDWLAELRRGGRAHAAKFTWDRCAAETASVYRSELAPTRQAA